MKTLKILTFTAIALALSGCNEEQGKTADAPAAAPAEMTAQVPAKQDIVLENQEQKYSYAMGARLANLLKGQMDSKMDQEAISAAIQDVFSGGEMQMTDREMKDAIIVHTKEAQQLVAEKGQVNLEKGQAFLAENGKQDGVQTLDSGLQFKEMTVGEGESPKETDTVTVHYTGALIDGTVFDSSHKRGEPTSFPLNGVIPGFKESIMLMKPGGKAMVYIPASLGYGERGAGGSIGPNEALVFEIDLIEIKPAAE